jgi:ankyrin repeat protein
MVANSGVTALHVACLEGHLDVVNKLIENPALLNGATKNGFTALHVACRKGHLEVVKQLLNAKPDLLDIFAKNGATALHEACLGGHKDIVEFLFNEGADSKCLTKRNIFGSEVIRNRITAIFHNDPDMKELINKITSAGEIKERDAKLKQRLNQDPKPSAGTTRALARAVTTKEGYQPLL